MGSARPRCSVCRSKRWHRDALSGAVVCQEGHLLSGFLQETNDTQEGPSQYTQTSRRMRKNRQKKHREPNNNYFHGPRATFVVYQAMQHILREQCRIVIDELGWPEELEFVVRDLWALLTVSAKVPPAPKDHQRDEEDARSYSGPREGSRYSRSGRKRRGLLAGEEEGEDSLEEPADIGGAAAAPAGAAPPVDGAEVNDDSETESDASSLFSSGAEGGEADHEGAGSDGSDDHSDSDASTASPPPSRKFGGPQLPSPNLYNPPFRRRRPPSRRPPAPSANPRDSPRMEFTLMLLYLACLELRLPVFLSDIFRLAESYRIPYLDAGQHLPAKLQKHLSRIERALLNPSAVPTLYPISTQVYNADVSAQSTLSRLVLMYEEDWDLHFAEANVEGLMQRICGLAGLPPFIATLTTTLFQQLPSPASIFAPSTSLFALPTTLHILPEDLRKAEYARRKPRPPPASGHWVATEPGVQDWRTTLNEVKIATAALLVLKMIFEGGEEGDEEMREYAKHLPAFERWLEVLDHLDALERPEDASRLWQKGPVDMEADEIDAYLDFFEEKIVSKETVPFRMEPLSRFFRRPEVPPSPLTPSIPPAYYLSASSSLLDTLSPDTVPPSFSSNPDSPSSIDYHTILERSILTICAHLLPPPNVLSQAFVNPAPSLGGSSRDYLLSLIDHLEDTLTTTSTTAFGETEPTPHAESVARAAVAARDRKQEEWHLETFGYAAKEEDEDRLPSQDDSEGGSGKAGSSELELELDPESLAEADEQAGRSENESDGEVPSHSKLESPTAARSTTYSSGPDSAADGGHEGSSDDDDEVEDEEASSVGSPSTDRFPEFATFERRWRSGGDESSSSSDEESEGWRPE